MSIINSKRLFARFTNTTPLARNKLHDSITTIRHEVELWPIVKKLLYILTVEMNRHELKRVARSKQ